MVYSFHAETLLFINWLKISKFDATYYITSLLLKVVAIKKMELPAIKAAEGEREFRVEVDILSRLDHPNLVSLIGYCADGKHRFLVYEYMRNGNLDKTFCNPLPVYTFKLHLSIRN